MVDHAYCKDAMSYVSVVTSVLIRVQKSKTDQNYHTYISLRWIKVQRLSILVNSPIKLTVKSSFVNDSQPT